ncbi:PTS sugar transporter subunit IIA [Streptococcus pluranimalium]|uniref:PTS sugar transporter n=1 Tax=Streptococcus pluranimalium TaxID=82348 RepID=A0A2L0D2M6_9STRE|nr:PTS sugar transporter subunit IIA [Streptococcus pluranimalium]AUW95944.1 PTS sugar transporter [Streptococcus pluranimalium]
MGENNIINRALIFIDEDLDTKDNVIKKVSEKAQEIQYVKDAQEYNIAVLKREDEVPTAIGYDIAIPHGKTDVVLKPFIAFLRSKKPFRWSVGSEEQAQLIFQIGVPETGTEKLHLKFISEVSKKLLDEEFRNKLLTLTDKEKIYELLNSINI